MINILIGQIVKFYRFLAEFNPSVAVIRVHTDLESRRPQESDRSSCMYLILYCPQHLFN